MDYVTVIDYDHLFSRVIEDNDSVIAHIPHRQIKIYKQMGGALLFVRGGGDIHSRETTRILPNNPLK